MKPRMANWFADFKFGFNLWILLVVFLGVGAGLVTLNGLLVFDVIRTNLAESCEAAHSAYVRGGREQLRSYLDTARLPPGNPPRLLDSQGRDVLTGVDRSDVLSKAQRFPRLFPPNGPILIVANPSYSCLLDPPAPRRARSPFGLWLWVLPYLTVLCFAVGAYVTWKMRRIEVALHHFGSGQLAVRANLDSGDAMGRVAGAFNQMAERIESLVTTQQRLVADAAHELRSPVTRLLTAISLAQKQVPGALDRIELEAGRMNDLVNELLEVARAEVDPNTLEAETVDLRSLLTEVADYCAVEAAERGCQLDLKLEYPGTVKADSEILRRAIENVVRNAIQHSQTGACIEVSCDGGAESVLIAIRDRGPGVPVDALDDIFRPFYRMESARDRRSGGVGLGLAIAQRAIELHRGTVWAENSEPGLRIQIRLPRNWQGRTARAPV